MPTDATTGESMGRFYNVVSSRVGDPIPLPRNPLNWTTISHILWDDLGEDALGPDQKTALLDWLHHGGQLIISGPDSLDKIQSGFLADYLPAKFKSSFNLTNEDIRPLNENWSVPVAKNPLEKRELVLLNESPLLGLKFDLHDSARFVDGTGELVVERRIGRGRVVVTSFSLDDPPLKKWRSLNSFFNGCLMRRPSRRFGRNRDGLESFEWATDDTSIFDPLVGSTLRFLSRDLGRDGTRNAHLFSKVNDSQQQWAGAVVTDLTPETRALLNNRSDSTQTRNLKEDVWRYGGFNDDIQSGTCGWNDASAISIAARATLKEAAGISPPSSDFVFKMLAVYLFVLVPVNWLLFRLMGKVEWAWIAAPFIAVAGAVVVVKLASLDIGFVRSNTQVGVVEAVW